MTMLLPPGTAPAPDGWDVTLSGLLIPQRRTRYDRPVGIDLFSGAGGFSLGMEQAGFHMAAAVEYDENAALTYLVNLARPGVKIHFDTPEREKRFTKMLDRHFGLTGKVKKGYVGAGSVAGDGWISGQPAHVRGCEHFWIADVRNLTGEQILAELGLGRGEVTVVCGGPPCQGYSMAGQQNIMDPRNSLVFEFARLCVEIAPKTFVMENVPNMASMLTPDGVPVIDALCQVMEDGGFGAHEALRASLLSHPGARAALRREGAKGSRRARPDREPDTDGEPEPATLFDLGDGDAA